MSFDFRRAGARLAVGLVAAAIPLVAASAASATLAGGNRFTSTDRPDLVSATITSSASASFCFDKPVTSIADVGGFYLGGYDANVTAKSLNATASGNCVNAQVGTSPDFTFAQVGEGAVRTTGNFGNRADSVALSGSNTGNGTRGLTVAPDLQGVSIVSGAAQQIAFTYDEPVSSSAIVGAGGFHFVTSGAIPSCPAAANAGCDIASNTASISATDPNTVIAQFPVGGVPIVTSAVRAYSLPGAVASATDGSPDGYDSASAPGSAGVVTGVPAVLSAQYSRQAGAACAPSALAACVVIDYTFNEGVSIVDNATTRANFFAYLSTATTGATSVVNPINVTEPSGCTLAGGGGLQGNPPCTAGAAGAGVAYGSNTVRAIFPTTLLSSDDYLVKAGVNGGQTTAQLSAKAGGTTFVAGCTNAGVPAGTLTLGNCAVISTTTGHPNTVGSAQIGGNNGGKGAGYSAAPDALFTSFDTLTNTAAITLDSRAFATSTPGNVQLLAADGSEIAGATALSACSPSTPTFPCALPTFGTTTAAPGPVTVWAQFPSPAVQVGNGKAIEIRGQIGGAFPFGFVWFNGLGAATLNLQDILAPAAVATANRHFAASHHWSHKRDRKSVV